MRAREVAARREAQAVEATGRGVRSCLSGLHWTEIPLGVTAAEVWAQAEKDARPRRRSVLEDALSNQGTVLHSLGPRRMRSESCYAATTHIFRLRYAVAAPVTVDFANMTLIVRRPDAAGGYESLLWREAHQALVKAEERGWPSSTRFVWGSAPGNYQFAHAAPGPNLTLLFLLRSARRPRRFTRSGLPAGFVRVRHG